MLDAMRRIWKLGNKIQEAFANHSMFYTIVGSYTAYFVSCFILTAATLYLHYKSNNGDVNSVSEREQLFPY